MSKISKQYSVSSRKKLYAIYVAIRVKGWCTNFENYMRQYDSLLQKGVDIRYAKLLIDTTRRKKLSVFKSVT